MRVKINILSPYRKGGPWQWSEDLARELNKNNIQARHVHGLFKLLGSPFFQNCDLVHTTVPIPFSLWNKPMVLTIHGDYRKDKNIWSAFYPLAIKKADRVTVPSEFLKKELGLKEAIVIPNGVQADFLPDKEEFNKNNFKFVTVTNFNFEGKVRGMELLIEILESLRQKVAIPFSLTIVGGGKWLNQIREKYKDRPYLTFTGYSEKVREILNQHDLFLYYSFHDNFPIAILEAMACGLPVISNNVGALEEIIISEKEGCLCKNEQDFLKNLEGLIAHPDNLPLIRKAAFQRVKDVFSWPRISLLYKKCCEELIVC